MSWSAKWSWNDDTPGRVPAGARISAGKLGNVDRSLPNDAVSAVNLSPVSCIPSPESPAKRITTRSSCLTSMVTVLFISKSKLGSAYRFVGGTSIPPSRAITPILVRP